MLRTTVIFRCIALLAVSLLLSACYSENQIKSARCAYLHHQYPEAFKQALCLAKRGDERAQYAVGNMYFYGTGTVKDQDLARYWISKSAKQCYRPAQIALDMIMRTHTHQYSPLVSMHGQTLRAPQPSLRHARYQPVRRSIPMRLAAATTRPMRRPASFEANNAPSPVLAKVSRSPRSSHRSRSSFSPLIQSERRALATNETSPLALAPIIDFRNVATAEPSTSTVAPLQPGGALPAHKIGSQPQSAIRRVAATSSTPSVTTLTTPVKQTVTSKIPSRPRPVVAHSAAMATSSVHRPAPTQTLENRKQALAEATKPGSSIHITPFAPVRYTQQTVIVPFKASTKAPTAKPVIAAKPTSNSTVVIHTFTAKRQPKTPARMIKVTKFAPDATSTSSLRTHNG